MVMIASRRTFLKAGLAGAIVLASAGAIYRATAVPSEPGKFVLDEEGKSALRAISLVMLQGTISADPRALDLAVTRSQEAIAGLPLATQKEVQDLFGLLVLAPTRRFVAGIPVPWNDASHDDVATFLQDWRTHRFAMLQTAYHALHDLIIGGWYADESNWASVGYPGPMKALG
jgi:hypothetical protein